MVVHNRFGTIKEEGLKDIKITNGALLLEHGRFKQATTDECRMGGSRLLSGAENKIVTIKVLLQSIQGQGSTSKPLKKSFGGQSNKIPS